MGEDPGQRIGRTDEHLEHTDRAVAQLHAELREIRTMLADLSDRITEGAKPNYALLLGGVGVLLSLYAAAIRPVTQQVDRLELDRQAAASALLHQAAVTTATEANVIRSTAKIEAIERTLEDVAVSGSPSLRARMAVLEHVLKIEAPR